MEGTYSDQEGSFNCKPCTSGQIAANDGIRIRLGLFGYMNVISALVWQGLTYATIALKGMHN